MMMLVETRCLIFIWCSIVTSGTTAFYVSLPKNFYYVKYPDDSNDEPDFYQAQKLLTQVSLVLDKTLTFAENNIDQVNLDGIIGLRSIEGQLFALLSRYWTKLPLQNFLYLSNIQMRSGHAAQLAIKYVKITTPVYYQRLKQMLVPNFWTVFYPIVSLKPQLVDFTLKKDHQSFDEKSSDDCIMELIGNNSTLETCRISKKCWFMIINKKNLSGYSLTHQVFYLLNGINANCLPNLTMMARSYSDLTTLRNKKHDPVQRLLDVYCANIYAEALSLEKKGFPKELRDLFLEQVGLCGEIGYTQIAQWRWLPLIKSWQREQSGCYGLFSGERVTIDSKNSLYGRAKRDLRQRKKRVEKVMNLDGCLSHRTSVAQSALLVFIRRLVQIIVEE